MTACKASVKFLLLAYLSLPVVFSVHRRDLRDLRQPMSESFITLKEDPGDANHQQTLQRMTWWEVQAEKPVGDKYLLFSPDISGMNNARIAWEMSGVVAQATNRTFVLPPPWRLDHVDRIKGVPQDTVTSVEDLINLKQLKGYLSTLTWQEFTDMTGLSWEEATEEAGFIQNETERCDMLAYRKIYKRILFMDGGRGHREGFFCGNWSGLGGPKKNFREQFDKSNWALLTHGFVWHQDIFDVAARAIHVMGVFEYNAIHARYNDFSKQFASAIQEPRDIMVKWWPFFHDAEGVQPQQRSMLYLATDEPEKFDNMPKNSGLEVKLFDNLNNTFAAVQKLYTPERWWKMLGPVEELICTFAQIFVGTLKSTFSSHINRMRIHADAPLQQVLNYMQPLPDMHDVTREIHAWKQKGWVKKPAGDGDIFLDSTFT